MSADGVQTGPYPFLTSACDYERCPLGGREEPGCEDGAAAGALINLVYHLVVEELVKLVLVTFH